MERVFFETPLFTRLLPKYLDDQNYRELQLALLRNPQIGDLMPGTGGFRKVRWQDARRGKSKRGGLRVNASKLRCFVQMSCRQRYRLCRPTGDITIFVGWHKALPLPA